MNTTIDIQEYIDEINRSVADCSPRIEKYNSLDGEKEYELPWDKEKLHIDCDCIMHDILERLGYTEILKAIDDAEEACGGFWYA